MHTYTNICTHIHVYIRKIIYKISYICIVCSGYNGHIHYVCSVLYFTTYIFYARILCWWYLHQKKNVGPTFGLSPYIEDPDIATHVYLLHNRWITYYIAQYMYEYSCIHIRNTYEHIYICIYIYIYKHIHICIYMCI